MPVTLEQATHTYRDERQMIIPGVTSVLEDVGIIDYGYLPEVTREAALKRGSAVHLATAFDDQGRLDEDSLNVRYRPYLDAWRKFRRDTGFRPRQIERTVHNEVFHYAGTLDREGVMGDGREVLVDIKCGTAQEWVRLQTAAYVGCLPNPRTRTRLVVELSGSGRYRIVEFRNTDWAEDFNAFLSCLTVWRMKRELQERAK